MKVLVAPRRLAHWLSPVLLLRLVTRCCIPPVVMSFAFALSFALWLSLFFAFAFALLVGLLTGRPSTFLLGVALALAPPAPLGLLGEVADLVDEALHGLLQWVRLDLIDRLLLGFLLAWLECIHVHVAGCPGACRASPFLKTKRNAPFPLFHASSRFFVLLKAHFSCLIYMVQAGTPP